MGLTAWVVLLAPVAGVPAAEEGFTAFGLRYGIREPLGPRGIPRDEPLDAFLEYGLLPMLSVRTGLEYSRFEIPSLGGQPAEDLEEAILSATVRYYKSAGRLRYFGSFGFGIFFEERDRNMEILRDADLGMLVGGGIEWTLGRHLALELEVLLESSGGNEPDSVLVWALGPKIFF